MAISMKTLLMMAVAGAFGTIMRFGLTGLVQKLSGGNFPWGTLVVNGAGCFLAGAVWAALEGKLHIPSAVRVIVLSGFMGAFTTFSAFMIETGHLAASAGWAAAAGNILLQNGIGIAAVFAGLAAGRAF